jgi:predicted dehydrogenase
VRIGLVGCGRHGSRYATHLLQGEIPGARLVAVSRRDAQTGTRFAHQHGLKFYPDIHSLVGDPDVEGVVVCLPPDLHPAAVKTALAAGRAVLVEKPLASTLAGAIEIEKAAAGRTLMVAHTLRFNSVVRAIEAHAPELGPLHLFSASQRHEPIPLGWVDAPGRGGALRITGVHAFDLARHLTGAEPARAWCQTLPSPRERADQAFSAILTFEPGPLLAAIDNTWLSSGRVGRLELVGTNGSLVGDHVLGTLLLLSSGKPQPLPVEPPVQTVRECLRSFVAAARGEIPVPVPAADGRCAVAMMDACHRSSETGEPVRVAPARS